MRILHLTLHREWFDKIASGVKRKEYRDVKPYWTKRLENKEYDEVHFKNGYHKDAPFMRVEWRGCKRKWVMGVYEKEVYVISLGEILEVRNYG